MDDLVKSLEGSFHVTHEENSTACPHPRYAQFKQKRSNSDQESRRKHLLEKQKSNRMDYMNLVRKLTDDDWVDNDKEEIKEEDEEEEEGMEVEKIRLKKPGRYYKDQLMLSEWLVEVPTDFRTEWMTVLCPVARRCLVVASNGKTKAYTKSGYCLNRFPSALPGGHFKSKAKGGTVLDCLYSEAQRTFYVLDLMCWNGHNVYDSETEFRFYWSHEKFQEVPSVSVISKHNPFIFVPLPSFECEASALHGALIGAKFEIDGLLFYHKRSHYIFGSTPLVVWLKPYMVPEILGIELPANLMTHMPQGYTNYADHMKQVEIDRQAYEKKKEERANYNPPKGRRRGKKVINIEMQEEENEEKTEEMEGNIEPVES